MRHCLKFQKLVAGFVAVVFFLFCGVVVPAQAAMIGTAEILSAQADSLARQKVIRFLDREDVVHHLEAWGVSASEARSRVDAMTTEEIRQLAARIDQLPAGGDALGFLVGISIVVFVVLIITDIIGVTDVFTFIKKR